MLTIFPCWDKGVKSYTRGGRVQCDVCGSFKGTISKNYLRKDKDGHTFLKLFMRCANCGSLQVTNNYTGEILKQERKPERTKKGEK